MCSESSKAMFERYVMERSLLKHAPDCSSVSKYGYIRYCRCLRGNINIMFSQRRKTVEIPVSAPKEPIAHPPDQLQKTFSTMMLLAGLYVRYELGFLTLILRHTLTVTHSSLLVTSTSCTQMLFPQTSNPSRPPSSPPRTTML
jgi:hypothetical protein